MKGKKPPVKTISRLEILNEIFSQFQQITQWLPSNIKNAFTAQEKAEILIEILEVNDCGSVGGFDKESPVLKESGFPLYDRFLALVRKHNSEKHIEPVCDYTLKTLKDYFIKLSKLREKTRK